MTEQKFVIEDVKEVEKVVKRIYNSNKKKRIFAFYGEVGAGKTTFIKKFCQILGVTHHTSSPTFSIINQYENKDQSSIYHIDCYRLNSIEEAQNIGIEENILSGEYCFIEWPEIIQNLLPQDYVCIQIKQEGKTRTIKVIS